MTLGSEKFLLNSLINPQLVFSAKGELHRELYEGSFWFECLSFTLGY